MTDKNPSEKLGEIIAMAVAATIGLVAVVGLLRILGWTLGLSLHDRRILMGEPGGQHEKGAAVRTVSLQ